MKLRHSLKITKLIESYDRLPVEVQARMYEDVEARARAVGEITNLFCAISDYARCQVIDVNRECADDRKPVRETIQEMRTEHTLGLYYPSIDTIFVNHTPHESMCQLVCLGMTREATLAHEYLHRAQHRAAGMPQAWEICVPEYWEGPHTFYLREEYRPRLSALFFGHAQASNAELRDKLQNVINPGPEQQIVYETAAHLSCPRSDDRGIILGELCSESRYNFPRELVDRTVMGLLSLYGHFSRKKNSIPIDVEVSTWVGSRAQTVSMFTQEVASLLGDSITDCECTGLKYIHARAVEVNTVANVALNALRAALRK